MPVLGVDLGRASCSVFVQVDADTYFGLRVEPIVTLTTKNEWLIGEDARHAAATGAGEAVWDLLMLQGRKMSELSTTELAMWPFRLVQGVAGKAFVEFHLNPLVPRTVFSPEELLAVLLARVRQLTERRAGCGLEETVLTIPVSYNYTQRQAIRDACAMAGLHVQQLVVSSTAAGVAHSLGRGEPAVGQLMLVIDFGAGSLDVSLVSMLSTSTVEVKTAVGDSVVSGYVLTERIMDHFMGHCNNQAAVATTTTLNRLRRASRLAKKILSTSDVASVQLQLDTGPFTASVTRAQFEALCSDCWDRIGDFIQLVLIEGHATADQVNSVLLCGGSAAIPIVRALVEKVFPQAEVIVRSTDELQAQGAAMLASQSTTLLDVTPMAFGVQRVGTRDVTILIPANVRVPARGDNVFFVGSQISDLAYRVLEGRHLRQTTLSSHGPQAWTTEPHCVGFLRILPPPYTLTSTTKPVVTKLSIAFDLSEERQLAASIANLATKQPVTTTFIGDDSVLPRNVITQTKTDLDRLFGAHRMVVHPDSAQDSDLNGSTRTNTMEAYIQTLRKMVETKTLVVTISDDDAQLLTTKIEEIQTWLHSSSTCPPQVETNDMRINRDEAQRTRVQELRRLHWSIVATAALHHLRLEMG